MRTSRKKKSLELRTTGRVFVIGISAWKAKPLHSPGPAVCRHTAERCNLPGGGLVSKYIQEYHKATPLSKSPGPETRGHLPCCFCTWRARERRMRHGRPEESQNSRKSRWIHAAIPREAKAASAQLQALLENKLLVLKDENQGRKQLREVITGAHVLSHSLESLHSTLASSWGTVPVGDLGSAPP